MNAPEPGATVPVETRLQGLLETIYRIEGPERAHHFRMPIEVSGVGREALLVHDAGECTDIGLVLDHQLLARTAESLDAGALSDLDAFAAALEGVSHFLYFTYFGGCWDRPVSQVELEIQAEVDKFITTYLVFPDARNVLVDRMFEDFSFVEGLEDEQRARYQMAHQTGRRYARWFAQAFERQNAESALRDARRLYRMSLAEKVAHCASAHVN